jgi:hypothetical protein
MTVRLRQTVQLINVRRVYVQGLIVDVCWTDKTIFKGAERARPLSKIVNLRQYKVGGAAHIAEERKVKE